MAIKSFAEIQRQIKSVVMLKKARESGETPKDITEVGAATVSDTADIVTNKDTNNPKEKTNMSTPAELNAAAPVKESGDAASLSVPTEAASINEECLAKCGATLMDKVRQSLAKKVAAAENPAGPEVTETKGEKSGESPEPKQKLPKDAAPPVAEQGTPEKKEEEGAKKQAAIDNVAEGINLNDMSLAKIAGEMLNTEEGLAFATEFFRKKAGEEYAIEAIKEAAEAANLYKVASEEAKKRDAAIEELVKRAYAAGAEDAAVAAQNPEVLNIADVPDAEIEAAANTPASDVKGLGDAEASTEEILGALSSLVDEEVIDVATADQLAQQILQAGEGNEEIDPQEIAALVDELVKSGQLTPEDAQKIIAEISGGEAAAAQTEGAKPETSEVPKEALSKEATAKLAGAVIDRAILLKQASVEGGEINPQDIIAELQRLIADGTISPEQAEQIAQLILAELGNAQGAEQPMPAPAAAPITASSNEAAQ